MKNINKPIICWCSGGVTSAVACKIAINLFGKKNCRFIFIDTNNEDLDTYRFLSDCEQWYEMKIESITNSNYKHISDVWYKFQGLNFAHGAICSSELKRAVRLKFQRNNEYSYQIFGFDIKEPLRALSLKLNYPKTNPIFPLLMYAYSKENCVSILQDNNIIIPKPYTYGFRNNNCFRTGCVQGGIGYWQKMRTDFPKKFNYMANIEHELTNLCGSPVTMLKDQSKKAKQEKNQLVFLKPHLAYPYIKDISMMKGREPNPILECNGFCGVNDLIKQNPNDINFDQKDTN